MTDEVIIDTNVWCMPDDPVHLECAQTCFDWLSELEISTMKILVDTKYVILGKYWDNLPPHSLGHGILSSLSRQKGRIVEQHIDFDDNGKAILPPELSDNLRYLNDEDWKFVALALARNPHPPIINAADTDWQQEYDILSAAGLEIKELCLGYIQQKLEE